jgi:tetratricopeptide (TPR) repeat protein
LQRTYGKSIEDLHRDLQAYYRSNSLNGVLFDVKLQKISVSAPRPATELESELTLAKLVALLRRRDEARTRYAALAKANPGSWEIFEALAHLEWQEGNRDQAKENFRRAVLLDPPNWKTYWDYARFAQGEQGTVEALRSAIRINPRLTEARLMLGYELYRGRRFQETYDVLAQVTQVTPDRAPQLFLMKAFSAIEIGKKPEAKTAAELAKKYAKTVDDIREADRLLEYIDHQTPERPKTVRTARAEPPQSEVEQEAITPKPPAVDRDARPASPEGLSQVRGVLQEIDCLGKEARIKILAGDTRVSLLIRNPDRVLIRNSDDSTVNMTCGPQNGTRVIIGFQPNDDPNFKTSGDIVTLEFSTRPVKR